MTGVEGYVESTASGLVAGLNAVSLLQGKAPIIFPETTMIGSMARYITHASGKHFQPINANFGIIQPLDHKVRDKKARNLELAQRALKDITDFVDMTLSGSISV